MRVRGLRFWGWIGYILSPKPYKGIYSSGCRVGDVSFRVHWLVLLFSGGCAQGLGPGAICRQGFRI